MVSTVQVHFAPLATNIPKHTRPALGNSCSVPPTALCVTRHLFPTNLALNVWRIPVHHCGQTSTSVAVLHSKLSPRYTFILLCSPDNRGGVYPAAVLGAAAVGGPAPEGFPPLPLSERVATQGEPES